MNQSVNKENPTSLDASGVKGLGILGWHAPDAAATAEQRFIDGDAMRSIFEARQQVSVHSTQAFSVATSGTTHALSNGGRVAITGAPLFRDDALAQLAKNEGAAAALAQGFEQHSQDIFARVNGAFACAIVDVANDRVLLAIDRMGQQSLYYRSQASSLSFASTAGAALAVTGADPELLDQGIYNYIYFHMVPSPGTVYRDLEKLPAAHYLDYSQGSSRLVNYWLPVFREASAEPFDAQTRKLKLLLRKSVEKFLYRPGKTAAFLSGGLDSSTVTGMLAEVSDHQASAYSIGFSAEGYDEMAFARIAARHFNVELNEYYVTPQDVVDALPLVATSYDEPFGNSSALPAYFCAKIAAENGVQTLLAGDGGDEFFGGNERYISQRVFEHYTRVPRILRSGLIEPLVKALPDSLPLMSKANSYIEQANTPLPDRLQSYNFLHRHAADEIFSADVLQHVDKSRPLELLRSIYRRPQDASDLNRMLYLDWQITLADNDLRKVSHTCALAGVDVVYPMLDDDLVEFSCQIPTAWKINGNNLRHFYKQSLRGWLPQETIDKRKQGFGLPFGVWMRTYAPLRELAYDNLLKLKSRGIIRPEFIDKAIAMHQSEHAAYYGELVWILTVFELWMSGHQASNAAPVNQAVGPT